MTDSIDRYKIAKHRGFNHVEYLEDKEGDYTFEEISSPGTSSLESTESIPNFNQTESAFWIRFRLDDQSRSGRRWLINTNRARTFLLHQILNYGLFPPGSPLTRFVDVDVYMPVTSENRER